MRNWFWLLLFVLGCSPRIVSYINPKSDFKSFETYRLVSSKLESKNVTPENTLLFDLIKKDILLQMDKRGYQKSNISPDLLLRYEITSNTRVETINAQNSFSRNPFPFQVNTRTIYESVLLLELFDNKEKLVWQGSYDLSQQKKEKKTEFAIKKAIGYIFATYPYQALSSQEMEL